MKPPFPKVFSMRHVVLLFSALSLSAAEPAFISVHQSTTNKVSPVRGMEEAGRFTLPPGFEIELVASEEQGAGKVVTVAWDDAGRMWAITALEYPLDGNEQPELAKALYEKGGRDRVLVFDHPSGPGPVTPHVFADGLAMPMGILPYKDGALVGDGPNVFWMQDTDGDGRADKKEVLLSGFGVQDSHLMPHQFTRAPGGWFYLAQGAFNYSRVQTRDGQVHRFDQTRLARFTVDGMKFEDVTCGPCNIWGLVIGREGETFIQEANDYGYPVIAYEQGASYPGCSGAFKPYAPYFPSEVEFRMGGTGLSGLALSDPSGSFPGAYANVMYVANPITRKVQAIRIHPEGSWYRYELLGDFVVSSDEWFRPVSIHFGPDGCLYIVDWYNKIISHNEVPRNHPDRDRTRGRIWRVRYKDQPRGMVPNIAGAADRELLRDLQAELTWPKRAAWHQIVDRKLANLKPDLEALAGNSAAPATDRIHAFWCLEDLGVLDLPMIGKFSRERNRNLRREAIRSLTTPVKGARLAYGDISAILNDSAADSDAQVRAQVLDVAALYAKTNEQAMALLGEMAKPALDSPVGKNPQNGAPMKLREAYDRDFERYAIRSALEKMPEETARFLASDAGRRLPIEARLLFALALPPGQSGSEIADLLPRANRIPNEEELLRIIENIDQPASLGAMKELLEKAQARGFVLAELLKVRNRVDPARLGSILEPSLKGAWRDGEREAAARVAGAFKVKGMADLLNGALSEPDAPAALQVAALRALREMDAAELNRLAALARGAKDRVVKAEALNSIVSTRADAGRALIVQFWPELNAVQRRTALAELTRTQPGATDLVRAVAAQKIDARDLNADTLDRLRELLPDDAAARELVTSLSPRFKPVLRLDGTNDSFVDSNITLDGPFTVECWVRLDPGIGNEDGILGKPGGADFNFAGGTFRVFCGPAFGDRLIARRPISPNSWTHLAVTRDSQGVFRLYLNGELDSSDPRSVTAPLTDLDIGRTTPNRGTAGELTEFRVWNFARAAESIRADFDRTFAGEPLPSGLVQYHPGGGPWGTLRGKATVEKISDAPALLTGEQARAQAAKFAKFRALAEAGGDLAKGRTVFESTCMICHSVASQGGQIGPVLNGAGANGIESLLRNVLTPNAAMEAGYRTFRVELKDGDTVDGFLVSRNDQTIILRQPNAEDRRIAMDTVRRADFIPTSLMPEGLLDNMPEENVRDLFAYLKTLK